MLVRFSDRGGFPAFRPSRGLPVSSLRRELDRLFGDLERAPSFAASSTPAVTFNDTGEALTVRAELPGLTEKEGSRHQRNGQHAHAEGRAQGGSAGGVRDSSS